MNHWILCGILVFAVLFCAWVGYKRGLLKVIFSTASLLVTLILASILSPLVQTALTDYTSLYDAVYDGCYGYVEEHVHISTDHMVDTSEMPRFIADALTPMLDGLDNSLSEVTASAAAGTARMILSAISFLLTFFLVGVIMRVVSGMLHVIDKLPVIHEGNHLAGLLLGFIQGIVAVWIFFLIVECSISTSFGMACSRMIEQNPLLSYVNGHNLLIALVEYFTKGTSLT